MPLPVSANTKCQIYRAGNAPPASPDVADVPCILKADFAGAQEHRDSPGPGVIWTHVMLIGGDVDVRDGYTGGGAVQPTFADLVVIPETSDTPFNVIFVELLLRGTANEHKRVYIDRQTPNWPTNEV